MATATSPMPTSITPRPTIPPGGPGLLDPSRFRVQLCSPSSPTMGSILGPEPPPSRSARQRAVDSRPRRAQHPRDRRHLLAGETRRACGRDDGPWRGPPPRRRAPVNRNVCIRTRARRRPLVHTVAVLVEGPSATMLAGDSETVMVVTGAAARAVPASASEPTTAKRPTIQSVDRARLPFPSHDERTPSGR
jgi:hypothetical protein